MKEYTRRKSRRRHKSRTLETEDKEGRCRRIRNWTEETKEVVVVMGQQMSPGCDNTVVY